MIQPFRCDFLTGAFLHRLLDVIARHIGKETVYPDADIFLLLGLKLALTIDGPA